MQYPHCNPDSPAAVKIKEVTEAYTVLIDGEKRSMYDRRDTGANNVAQDSIPRFSRLH
jgi:DnaJ-class molecular chaperone